MASKNNTERLAHILTTGYKVKQDDVENLIKTFYIFLKK